MSQGGNSGSQQRQGQRGQSWKNPNRCLPHIPALIKHPPGRREREKLNRKQAQVLGGCRNINKARATQAVAGSQINQAQRCIKQKLVLIVSKEDEAAAIIDFQTKPQTKGEQTQNMVGFGT